MALVVYPHSITPYAVPRYIIENLVLGGKHVLASTWFTWDISGSYASENDNGYGGGSFGIPNQSTFGTSPCTYDPGWPPELPYPRDGRKRASRRPTTLLFTP